MFLGTFTLTTSTRLSKNTIFELPISHVPRVLALHVGFLVESVANGVRWVCDVEPAN